MLDVLVVDDAPFIGAMIAGLCKDEGWTSVQTHSLAAARKALKKNTPRVVILDYQLPDGQGTELMEDLTNLAESPHVIALAMQPRTHVNAKFATHGVSVVLDKEVILQEQILSELRSRLNR